MEDYDMIVLKTVKDLFKSNTLNQIQKYKQSKEKEIKKGEEDLKKLILEKYPFLIKSLSNLEEIYTNIPILENLRQSFQKNIESIKCIDENQFLFDLDLEDKDINQEFNEYLDGIDKENFCDNENNFAYCEQKTLLEIEGNYHLFNN